MQDAHQPFHATDNYDGAEPATTAFTPRFERDLFERFEARLKLRRRPPAPMANARDATFDALLASYQLVDAILEADKDASRGRSTYDDEYFDAFFVKVQPMLEQQRLGGDHRRRPRSSSAPGSRPAGRLCACATRRSPQTAFAAAR